MTVVHDTNSWHHFGFFWATWALVSDLVLSCCLPTVLQNWSCESTGVITHPYWDASPPMPAALWYTWTTPWRRPVLTPLRCPASAVSCPPLRPEPVEKTLWWAHEKKIKNKNKSHEEACATWSPLTNQHTSNMARWSRCMFSNIYDCESAGKSPCWPWVSKMWANAAKMWEQGQLSR